MMNGISLEFFNKAHGPNGRFTTSGGGAVRGNSAVAVSVALEKLRAGGSASLTEAQLLPLVKEAAATGGSTNLAGLSLGGEKPFAGLGMKREDMPQIPGPHKPEFIAELRSEGVRVTEKSIDPSRYRASQSELRAEEVGNITDGLSHKPILVSSDGYVIDGHHRWAGARAMGKRYPAVEIGLPVKEALARAGKFMDKKGIPSQDFSTLSEGVLTIVSVLEFACRSAACRPPTSGGTGGSVKGMASGAARDVRIKVTGRGAGQEKVIAGTGLGHGGIADYTKDQLVTMTEHFVKSTGLKLGSAEAVVQHLDNEIQRQVTAHRAVDPLLASKYWYDAANGEAAVLSAAHGSKNSALGSALLAVTSPQTPWPDNLRFAKSISEMHRSGVISEADARTAYRDSKNSSLEAYRSGTEDAFVAEHAGRRYGDPTLGVATAGAIANSVFKAAKPASIDQKLRVTKDGEYDGYDLVEGAPAAAKSSAMFVNGFKITRAHEAFGDDSDGLHAAIDQSLGAGSKVRSFYNNINDPASERFVTVDTHAVAGASGFPVGGNQPLTKDVFTPVASTGVAKTYPLYQEAFNRVAAREGLLPRQIQSITWIQQRDVEWPDTVKSAYTKAFRGETTIVSHLQRQLAVSSRGPDGVKAGIAYRDTVNRLLKENVGATAARRKAIASELTSAADALNLSPQRLSVARPRAAAIKNEG